MGLPQLNRNSVLERPAYKSARLRHFFWTVFGALGSLTSEPQFSQVK
jgi:hypothetical protein